MSEFQKEIGVIVVLLAFLLGCLCYVETAHTEATGRSRAAINQKVTSHEDQQGACESNLFGF